jgi:hypothetical protein
MVKSRVYRPEGLLVYSKAIDRELARLISEKNVVKAGAGLYYRPGSRGLDYRRLVPMRSCERT